MLAHLNNPFFKAYHAMKTKAGFTEEVKEKCRHHMIGRKLSEQTKQKIRISNLGKTVSDITRQKLSKSMAGRKPAPNTIAAVIKAKTGSIPVNRRPVKGSDGSYYASVAELNKAIAMPRSTLVRYIKDCKPIDGVIYTYVK